MKTVGELIDTLSLYDREKELYFIFDDNVSHTRNITCALEMYETPINELYAGVFVEENIAVVTINLQPREADSLTYYPNNPGGEITWDA